MWRMHQPHGHIPAQPTGRNKSSDSSGFSQSEETEGGLLFQFMFEVRRKAQEVLICLQQEDRRSRRKDGEGENLPIGFEVLKVRRAVKDVTSSMTIVIFTKYFTSSKCL